MEREEKRWGTADQGSVFLGEVRREKLAGEGEVFLSLFFFLLLLPSPLSSSVCGACCLIETCPASCLPLTYIPGTGGWHLATSVAQHAQFPCRSSPKECSGAQREKVNLQACTARRRVAISLWGKKKKNLLFFVVFLSLQHFVIFENTQEHQRYFYSLLLLFFFLVICLEVKKKKKKKNEVETTDNKATNKK